VSRRRERQREDRDVTRRAAAAQAALDRLQAERELAQREQDRGIAEEKARIEREQQ